LTRPREVASLRKLVGRAVAAYRDARAQRQQAHRGDLRALEASFDRALESLRMAYQPIVRPSVRAVYAYEALARPVEPGLHNPGLLFGAADRLMRVQELGRVVRARVAAQVDAAPCGLVFVNLHPLELLDDALYAPAAPLSRVGRPVG